jgi:hypothetical protein
VQQSAFHKKRTTVMTTQKLKKKFCIIQFEISYILQNFSDHWRLISCYIHVILHQGDTWISCSGERTNCSASDGGQALSIVIFISCGSCSCTLSTIPWTTVPLYNAFAGVVTRNIVIAVPGRSCMTHRQYLTAAAAKITLTKVQMCPMWYKVPVWFDMLLNSVTCI